MKHDSSKSITQGERRERGAREEGEGNLFDHDDSLLCGLVRDDVEYVVTSDDAVLHLSIPPNIRIIGLNAADGSSDLCGLGGDHTEGI